jgi:hypothetical protein
MAIKNQIIAATETSILTATTDSAVVSIIFYNADTATRTVTLYAYPTGGSAGNGSTIAKFDIPTTDSFIWTGNEKLMLETSGVISALCDVAGKVTATINYLEL